MDERRRKRRWWSVNTAAIANAEAEATT